MNDKELSNTTKSTIMYIKYIQRNKQYLEIGIKKYQAKFDIAITNINNLLEIDFLSSDIKQIVDKLVELDFIDYMSVVDEISILGENLNSIEIEEKNPMLPFINKSIEEDEQER